MRMLLLTLLTSAIVVSAAHADTLVVRGAWGRALFDYGAPDHLYAVAIRDGKNYLGQSFAYGDVPSNTTTINTSGGYTLQHREMGGADLIGRAQTGVMRDEVSLTLSSTLSSFGDFLNGSGSRTYIENTATDAFSLDYQRLYTQPWAYVGVSDSLNIQSVEILSDIPVAEPGAGLVLIGVGSLGIALRRQRA